MNAYSVVKGGIGFQVIESRPNGGEPRVLAAFVTQAAAIEWLGTLLGMPLPPDGVEHHLPKI